MCSTGTGTGVGVGVGTDAAGGAAAGAGSKLSIVGAGLWDAVCVARDARCATAFVARTECFFAVGITAAGPPVGALETVVGAAGGAVTGSGVGAVAAELVAAVSTAAGGGVAATVCGSVATFWVARNIVHPANPRATTARINPNSPKRAFLSKERSCFSVRVTG